MYDIILLAKPGFERKSLLDPYMYIKILGPQTETLGALVFFRLLTLP